MNVTMLLVKLGNGILQHMASIHLASRKTENVPREKNLAFSQIIIL